MNRRAHVCGVTMLLAAVGVAAGSPRPEPPGRTGSWDRYRVLAERNIFARDRRRPRPVRPVSTRPAAPTDPDRYLVLTGIARREAAWVAFIENTRTGETARVAVGEAAGKGKLKAITLDGVDYECDGTVASIKIGRSLAGTPPVSAAATTTPSGPGTSGTAEGPETTDILERMRRRRQQELDR